MTGPAASQLSRIFHPLVSWWRRSLQRRVAVTTFVVSGVAVAVLGVILLNQVTASLLHAKVSSALAQLSAGVQTAEAQFGSQDRTSPDSFNITAHSVVARLENRGPAGFYGVLLMASEPSFGRANTPGVGPADVPAALRRAVGTTHREAYAYTALPGRGHQPALVAGAAVTDTLGPPYELYYVFPLHDEAATVSLVTRTLLFAGGALVLLLMALTALVTRQVVTPVRLAADTAGRLAAGRLAERMRVRGDDELARLASSFNEMASALQAQIRKLEELSRVQRQFVADVSHELRTPLTTVRMAADLLFEARGDFGPEVARSAELLENQLGRFEALLADLLEISRHDAGVVVLDREPVDLRAVVADAVEEVEPVAHHRGSEVAVHVPREPVVAEVDPRRIGRVLRNLLCNAVEHGEGRPVEVSLRQVDGAAVLSVSDHGVGLRPGEAELVFHRFWRADPARARTTGGTGLGLAIALEDSRLHGGTLRASGVPGRGSRFVLTLPLPVETNRENAAPPVEPGVPPSRPPAAGVPVRPVDTVGA